MYSKLYSLYEGGYFIRMHRPLNIYTVYKVDVPLAGERISDESFKANIVLV